jgi:hypothetical protein
MAASRQPIQRVELPLLAYSVEKLHMQIWPEILTS